MPLKTTRWDSADYLQTEADRTAYLEACLEEAPEDAAFIAQALGTVARSRNMSQLARDTGLTREGLYKSLSNEGNPSFGTVLKVVNALGYRLALARVKKGPAKAPRAPARARITKMAAKKTSTRSPTRA